MSQKIEGFESDSLQISLLPDNYVHKRQLKRTSYYNFTQQLRYYKTHTIE